MATKRCNTTRKTHKITQTFVVILRVSLFVLLLSRGATVQRSKLMKRLGTLGNSGYKMVYDYRPITY